MQANQEFENISDDSKLNQIRFMPFENLFFISGWRTFLRDEQTFAVLKSYVETKQLRNTNQNQTKVLDYWS